MACRSRSRSPVEASFTHGVGGIYLDEEIDFEFPMLTDEDIDCIVEDISDAGGAPLGSIEKPLAIDAIQKHVEESLLFLDEEKSTHVKSENKTGAPDQKIHLYIEKSESDDTVMQDVDNSSNTGEPQKNSTVILKQENINDASLSDEQQKGKSEIESITTENKVVTSLEHVKQETSNIPEQKENNDIILSLEDNPISDSVLNEIDKDTAMNYPQEETSGISEQSNTVKVIVSQEDNPPSVSAVHETDTVENVSQQKSKISLPTDGKKANIVSLEEKPTPDTVLNEVDKDAAINYPQKENSDISEQIDTSKVIVSEEDNPLSDSALHKTDTDAVVNVSLERESKISQLTDSKKANIESLEENPTFDSVLNEINKGSINAENKRSELLGQNDGNKARNALQENNPSSLSMLNETVTDATIYDSELKSSDILELSDPIKVCNTSQEDNPSSDNMLNETDTDATMNYDSQEELGDNSKQMITNEISNDSQVQKSPSEHLLNKTDLDANMNDNQEGINDIPRQTDEMDGSKNSNVLQEENRTSEVLLEETDTVTALNGPQEDTRDISERIGFNEISNISQVDNNLILYETDTDAPMSDSLEIPEQIEMQKVDKIYKYRVLNKTNTDVAINDSLEEIGDISELIDSKEVSMVSQENLPSDSVLNKTDTDEAQNDSQEEINDTKTYNNGKLNKELDKTDAVLHEGCETYNKTIETAGYCLDNLKSIKIEDHENSLTEPQQSRILVESKEINNQTDEPTEGIKNTTRDDKKHDKLPELERNVEKSSLPENETQVKKEMNEIEQATQKSQEKELVWEIKSIKHEPTQQKRKELLEKESSQERNVTENPTKKNLLVGAAASEDVTECPPAKRPRFQPVWTTNPLNDEDKPKAEQATCFSKSDNTAMEAANDNIANEAPVLPYYILSQEVKKQLQTWILKSGLGKRTPRHMKRLVKDARWNKAVLRMAPIPKDYKMMDVFGVIRNQIQAYDKDIIKSIQFIHIDKHDDNFNAAYIKWRDIDKLLVVKAYEILVSTKFTIDGVVKKPLFKYDDRSVIDWNERDRPILIQKGGDIEISQKKSTPAHTPVVTSIATVAVAATTSVTPVAKPMTVPVATPGPTPSPRKPPPPPFKNGELNAKDRQSFGLSKAFMDYHNLKPPIVCFVFVKNLDMSHSVEKYHRIFSAAGHIVEMNVMPCHDELYLKLRIDFNHVLEAVQAVSMFHEQILYDRVIEVEMGHVSMKKRPFTNEGFSAVGPGLGVNGYIMRNIRLNIEISKLRARTKVEFDNFREQISSLRQKLAEATFKMEQAKREQEKKRYKEEKKQLQCQYKQASMDAVNAITTAIASSVQANVMGMLGIQPNEQGQNMKQNSPSAPVNNQPGGMPQSQNTSRAPVSWTANEKTATTLPNQNMPGPTSMENAFRNLGNELHRYQNPLDLYSFYPNMQQAYAQYGYTIDPTSQAYVQSGTSYIQPGIANVQPVPAIETFNMSPMTPKTQSMPTIISNQPIPSKLSNPTQSKVQSKTILPPLPTTDKNVTVYEKQKTPLRFDDVPANVGNKTKASSRFDVPPAKVGQTTAAESKVPATPLPIPTISQPAVQTAFKIQKPIVPPKVTKQASINMKIPSVLPTVPLVLQNPRTLEKNNVQRKCMKLAGKLPAERWINKQVRDLRKNSKSPEKNRKFPEKIKSPDRSQKTLPKAIQPPKTVRRMSKSPDRKRMTRSPVRRNSRSPIRQRSRSTERRRVSRSPKSRMSRSPIRRRSRSTERRRVSRSPKRRMSRSPIRRRCRSPIRRRSRSTERRRISRSPIKRISRSPIRGRSRSTERRQLSRSPNRRMSRSPKRRISRSPIRRKSRSPTRGVFRSPKRGLSRSPVQRKSKSPIRRRSRTPKRGISRSPKRGISRSPRRENSRSPKRGISRSPKRRFSKSPIRRKSRSPVRRISKSPVRKISRSPYRRISRSPVRRRISRSPVRRLSKSPVGRLSGPPSEIKGISKSRSFELGPKPTPRPAYELDGASKTNLDLGDKTANYNYIREMERELAKTSINFCFLPPSVTTEDLTDKMSEIGELLEVRPFGMGKAMVVFKFRHDAETCIEMYNMAKVDGQMIEVRWASIE